MLSVDLIERSSERPGHVLSVLAVVGFLYIFGVVVYRLSFHPLAKYPGPLLGRVTDWYSVYHAIKGTRHLDFYQLHQSYGDIVRYGPNSISINTNTALNEIYAFKANVKKAKFYTAFPAKVGAESTHSMIDKNLHARKRRVLSQAFSDNTMKGLQPHVLHVIRTFCKAIGPSRVTSAAAEKQERPWSSPRNMANWTDYMSYDVLGDICYGQTFGTLEREENRFAIELVGTSSKFHYLNGQMPKLKKLGLDRVLFPTIRANRQRFMAYSKRQLENRMKMGMDADRRDFFYYLLNAKDPETGEGFTIQELWGESNVLLIAGSDTTSTALSACFFHLLHNPRTLEKLASEVRSTFSEVEEITLGPQLTSCRYLRACIDEAMRLSPPVASPLPREVMPGGIVVDGHHFPEGTILGTSAYALHHNKDYYPQPFTYMPERWIVGESENGQSRHFTADDVLLAQSAFCPFSIGPRGCIGKGVAYLELGVALARTIMLYRMRLSAGKQVGISADGQYELSDIFVAHRNGPVVEFQSRI